MKPLDISIIFTNRFYFNLNDLFILHLSWKPSVSKNMQFVLARRIEHVAAQKMTSKPWGHLPVSRITTIMKSSSDAEKISKQSSQLMTKAAELFIKTLTEEAYKLTDNGKKLDYKHLAEVVNGADRYEFLRDIMPKKITVLEYKKILAKKQQSDEVQSNSSSSSEEDDKDSGTGCSDVSSSDDDGDKEDSG